MEHLITTLVRTLLGFFILLLLTRILGKKQLSQMTMFTYITGIALGNIAGDMVVHRDIRILDGVMGLLLWTLLAIGVEFLSLKSAKARIILDGEPTIIIKNGKLVEKALHSNRMNVDDLTMLLRDKGIFAMQHVDYAILEPNGMLSVLKKIEHENASKQDVNVTVKRKFLPAELISDGKLVRKNLKETSVTEEWLQKQLLKNGILHYSDVFYAEIQEDGGLYIQKHEKKS
ncbi:YetF domain-containing protein [Metabacillus sp. RGM 3146]|uniref:YetF domain-containing protein n=1 Tax=Metabacillus sp. RGM 3146 TaxID=3401092 RepID=UPI003B9B4E53